MDRKSVLITGCSSGIGLCVAEGLKRRGYRVFATARKQEDVQKLIDTGFESVQLDLDSSQSINQALSIILDRTDNQLYGLINNGAYGQPGAVEDLSRSVLRKQFETNLFGTHELTNAIIPIMRQQGKGRIIQISSVLGFVSLAYRGAYNASKYALEALSDTLRLELRNTGIYVSVIEPGPIVTHFRENSYAAFKANIDSAQSAHQKSYHGIEQRLSGKTGPIPFTLPPDAVLKKVIRALESRRPGTHYAVTFPTYLFATLKRLLPAKWLDQIMYRVGDGINK